MRNGKVPLVLVVDDDKYARDSMIALLTKWGIETDDGQNGAVAIEKLQQRKYSLILLDMKMDNKNGLDVLEEMKRYGIPTPVVLMTAYPCTEEVDKTPKYGVVAGLIKPIDSSILKKVIKTFIDIPG